MFCSSFTAFALEKKSEHPLAKAILLEAERQKVRADDTFLSFRKDSGNDLINACLPSDRPCCPLIVPGQHDYPDSHVLQFFYGSCTLFFDHIRYCDHTEQTVFFCKKQRRLSIFCQCFPLAFLFL